MPKTLLSVNVGSSSMKITFYTLERPPKTIADLELTGITSPPQILKYKQKSTERKEQLGENVTSPQDAFRLLLHRCFTDPEFAEVSSSEDLAYMCHRVVHGGDFDDAVEINDKVYSYLTKIENLAPLHNYSALEIIRTCMRELPKVKSIAYFDTAFHKTLPRHIKTYPIDQETAKANRLRKYGFHGISYSFILRTVAQFLGKVQEKTTLVTMHLGSGASICAIRNGKSIDTSMGSTPLAGLPGATRSGDVDPSIIFHYTNEAGSPSSTNTNDMHISTAEAILNQQSGWKALTGTTDFSQIAVKNPPSENYQLAFEIFVDRIVGYIGSYFTKLDGQVDALVFAAGIGEKNSLLREVIIERCRCLGFFIDLEKNAKATKDGDPPVVDISKEPAKSPRVLICYTNEQFEMAYHTMNKFKIDP